jgi:hypothetical protein
LPKLSERSKGEGLVSRAESNETVVARRRLPIENVVRVERHELAASSWAKPIRRVERRRGTWPQNIIDTADRQVDLIYIHLAGPLVVRDHAIAQRNELKIGPVEKRVESRQRSSAESIVRGELPKVAVARPRCPATNEAISERRQGPKSQCIDPACRDFPTLPLR